MIKNKKILIIVGVALIIIVIILVCFFYLKKEKQTEPSSMTQEQKIQILDKLSAGADTSPAGIKMQEDALKKLNGGKVESQPLTNEERLKIMNSFN